MINCIWKISYRKSVCLFLLTFCFIFTFWDIKAENTVADGSLGVGIVTSGVTVIEGDLTLRGLDVYYPGDLVVKGNVLLEDCEIVLGGNVAFYGDVVVREGASMKREGGEMFCAYFLGGKDVKYDVWEEGLVMRNVMVSKSEESVLTVAEGCSMMFNGRFDAWGGRIKGKVQNTGKANIVDKLNVRGEVMRDVVLVLGKKSNFLGPDVVFETDVWVKRIDADHLLAVYIGSNKLRMEEMVVGGKYVYWGKSTGFITNGTAADGGVEMPIKAGNELSVGFYQLAPPNKDEAWIATIDGKKVYEYKFPLDGNKLPNYTHTPVTVHYTKDGGYVRVAPNSSIHGGLVSDLIFSVGDIYWRVESTDSGESAEELYTMAYEKKYYTKPIKDYKKVVFRDMEWREMGEYIGGEEMKIGRGDGGTGASGDYTFADSRYVKSFRRLVSKRSGKWGDAIWAEVDASGREIRDGIGGDEIGQTDKLTIKEGHRVETDNVFGQHMPSVLELERDEKDVERYGTLVLYMDHLNKALREQKMYVGGRGEMECHMTAGGLTGKMSMIDFTQFVINEGSHLTIVNEGGISSVSKSAKSLIWPSVYRLPNVTFKGKKVVLRDVGNGFFGGDVSVESGEVEFILTCMSSMDIKGKMKIDSRSVVTFTGEESVCSFGGDVEIEGRLITQGVALNLDGQEKQMVHGALEVEELWINNGRGVIFDRDAQVKRLALRNGVVYMGENKMRVDGRLEGGSEWSYIDGRLERLLFADQGAMFPVGDGSRYGCVMVKPGQAGEVSVVFSGQQHGVATVGDYVISQGYWAIRAEGELGVQLYYDEESGGVSGASDIVVLESGSWEVAETMAVWSRGGKGALYAEREVAGVGIFAFGIREALCIWRGQEDEDWANAKNWKGCVMPDKDSDALIPGSGVKYWPMVRCAAEVRDVMIEEGARMGLAGSEGRMFVAGDVDNKGDWDLYYRCTDMPALCVKGEIVGNDARVIRSFLRGRLYYAGTAVADGKVWGMKRLNEETGDVMHAFDGTFVDVGVEEDEERGMAGIFEGATMLEKVGSIALSKERAKEDNMVVQYGKPLTMIRQRSSELSEGWHWLSNPYPFAVDVRRFMVAEKGSIAPTVYARGYDYGYHFFTYNTAVGVGASGNEGEDMLTIGAFESFAIYVEEECSVVAVDPVYAEGGQERLKSCEISREEGVLRLVIGSGGRTDELVLCFEREEGEWKGVKDSYKYGAQPRASYQIYMVRDGERVAIALMPRAEEMEGEKMVFSVMATGGWETDPVIRVRGLDSVDDRWGVYVEDGLTGKRVDMRQEEEWEIEAVDELYEGRFAVVLEARGVESRIREVEGKKSDAGVWFDLLGRVVGEGYRGIVVGREGVRVR